MLFIVKNNLTALFAILIFNSVCLGVETKYMKTTKYASTNGSCIGSIRTSYKSFESDIETVDNCTQGAFGDIKYTLVSADPYRDYDEKFNYNEFFSHRLNVKYWADDACQTRREATREDGASVREGRCYKGVDHIENGVLSFKFSIISENTLMETRYYDNPNCTGINPARHYFKYNQLIYINGKLNESKPEHPNPVVVNVLESNGTKKTRECEEVCPDKYINRYGEEVCVEHTKYYVTWTLDTRYRGHKTDLKDFFLVLLYIGLVPIGITIVFWGPVTALRRSKDSNVKKVTIVQVTPAGRNAFNSVAPVRKKAKI